MEIDPDLQLERDAEVTAERVMDGGELGIQRLAGTDVHVQRMPGGTPIPGAGGSIPEEIRDGAEQSDDDTISFRTLLKGATKAGISTGIVASLAQSVALGAGITDPETFWRALERHEDSQLDAFRAGERTVYDDVGAIRELPGPRGVVSNNHRSTLEFVLSHFELASLFDCYYGRPMTIESLSRKKPSPYYVERALEDLGAASALYVGDSESDVVAAERAGLDPTV